MLLTGTHSDMPLFGAMKNAGRTWVMYLETTRQWQGFRFEGQRLCRTAPTISQKAKRRGIARAIFGQDGGLGAPHTRSFPTKMA